MIQLEKEKKGKVHIQDSSDSYCLIAVQGPQSEALLQQMTEVDLSKIKYYRFRSGIEFIKSNYRIRLGLIQDAGETISGKKIAIENGLKNFKFLGGFGVNINQHLKLDFCIDLGKQDEGVSHLISISFKK